MSILVELQASINSFVEDEVKKTIEKFKKEISVKIMELVKENNGKVKLTQINEMIDKIMNHKGLPDLEENSDGLFIFKLNKTTFVVEENIIVGKLVKNKVVELGKKDLSTCVKNGWKVETEKNDDHDVEAKYEDEQINEQTEDEEDESKVEIILNEKLNKYIFKIDKTSFVLKSKTSKVVIGKVSKDKLSTKLTKGDKQKLDKLKYTYNSEDEE